MKLIGINAMQEKRELETSFSFFRKKDYVSEFAAARHDIDKAILNLSLGITSAKEDFTQTAYMSDQAYVLARTFKSGDSNGVETELSYLENRPGHIYFNPTTVINQQIPSKTISQLPGTDWSGQPSFLFSIYPSSKTTIAHHGIGSLNSFSSTDAMVLLDQLNSTKTDSQKEKPTMVEKLSCLRDFLQQHWFSKIDDVTAMVTKASESTGPIKKSVQKSHSGKKFYKPFELDYHKKKPYDHLMTSLAELSSNLKTAYNLSEFSVTDIPLDKDIAAILINWLPQQIGALSEEQVKRAKKLLRGISDYLKEEQTLSPHLNEKRIEDIYARYCDFLDTGARHNELLSRVYIWEITGLEWGIGDKQKENAVADLISIVKERNIIYDQLQAQGVNHSLFIDFMMNKLSLDNPLLKYSDLKKLYEKLKREKLSYFETILAAIMQQLSRPVFIYEYSSAKRELINVSNYIANYQDLKAKNPLVENKKANDYIKIFNNGLDLYRKRHDNKIVIEPPSFYKKIALSLDVTLYRSKKRFWERKPSEAHFLNVLQIIADNIINQPYLDDKRVLVDSQKKVIYRPNHDVTHAMRKVSYLTYLFDRVKNLNIDSGADIVKSFTDEEMACIKLAMFLSRAGRTNEQGSRDDPSYLERSANIFAAVAKELDFDKKLIETLKKIICYQTIDVSIAGFKGTTPKAMTQKIELVGRLMDISHETDLVRTNSWRTHFSSETEYLAAKKKMPFIKNFQFALLHKIEKVFGSESLAKKIQDDLLLLAKKSCEVTGTPVCYDGFPEKTKVQNYELPLQDTQLKKLLPASIQQSKLKDIKSVCTSDISFCYQMLDILATSFMGKDLAVKDEHRIISKL